MVKKSLYFLGIFLILLSISMVSAGLGSWLTGKATTQPTDVTVKINDRTPAEIQYVSPISPVTPIEDTYVPVTFTVHVYDKDKLRDINFTATYAKFTNGLTTRQSTLCTPTTNISQWVAAFSCTIDMWYWDTQGTWNIDAQGRDLGNGTVSHNTTTTFTYNQLEAMVISPNNLTWPALDIGAPNQTSNNDPTIINNTGNYNGTIAVTGYDLVGEADTSQNILIANFSSSIQTGAPTPECGEASSNVLNNTGVTIDNADPNAGNLSLNTGAGQARLYYCLRNVPDVLSQNYSTLNSQSWVVAYGA